MRGSRPFRHRSLRRHSDNKSPVSAFVIQFRAGLLYLRPPGPGSQLLAAATAQPGADLLVRHGRQGRHGWHGYRMYCPLPVAGPLRPAQAAPDEPEDPPVRVPDTSAACRGPCCCKDLQRICPHYELPSSPPRIFQMCFLGWVVCSP